MATVSSIGTDRPVSGMKAALTVAPSTNVTLNSMS
jgi:hypothetical protein